jgi:hypothetical protein
MEYHLHPKGANQRSTRVLLSSHRQSAGRKVRPANNSQVKIRKASIRKWGMANNTMQQRIVHKLT